MTEIVIITHGNLAIEINKVAEKILGAPSRAITICLDWDESYSDHAEKIKNLLQNGAEDQKRIILTDLFGGSPSNLTIPYLVKGKTEVITGMNLPMLIYLLSAEENADFKELCEGAKRAGMDAIFIAGKLIQ